MVRSLIEWLLDAPNPEIDSEYADPTASDIASSDDDRATDSFDESADVQHLL